MTQHHDPVHPDEGDRPVPDDAEPMLAPQDEAYVTGLLAGLPPVEMPADVASALDAAIAREAAGRAPSGGTVTEPAVEAATTVVPLESARGRRARGGQQRRTRILQVAAGVALLAVGGVVAVDLLRSSGTGSESAGAAAPAEVPVDRTGHTYTDASLESDVQQLAAGTLPTESPVASPTPDVTSPSSEPTDVPSTPATGQVQSPTSTEKGPSPSSFAVEPYIFGTEAELVPCLTAVEDGLPSGVAPVAMDQGTYQGQPVLVVVLPGYTDPAHTYDVYIVGEDCGQDADAHMLLFRSVPKP